MQSLAKLFVWLCQIKSIKLVYGLLEISVIMLILLKTFMLQKEKKNVLNIPVYIVEFRKVLTPLRNTLGTLGGLKWIRALAYFY